MSTDARRLQDYYDQSLPPSLLPPGSQPATGATAGIPGSWTPPGSLPPVDVAHLQGNNPVAVTASPATAWTSGQFVQTRLAGAAGRATWTGTGWVGGAAPLAEPPTSSDTKATIVAWLLGRGVDLDEEALSHLNKAELLDLVDELTNEDD